jgi:hypothetical protein
MNADEDSITDEFADLTVAAQTSLAFWDNPLDNEDWSDEAPGEPAILPSG